MSHTKPRRKQPGGTHSGLFQKLLPTMMKSFPTIFCLALSVSISQPPFAESKRLHFGQCSLTANLQEIQDYFSEIKHIIQAEDTITDTRFLTESIFHGIQAEESCCFLRHLLRFYVETVFKHHTPSSSLIERRTSSLANSFLSIKRDLRQCVSNKDWSLQVLEVLTLF
ncbi:interleukin-20-like [Chiloscyllium plagiosum]|uniref:interleukin-20-like n=1 Tax=Chiloscyllium plagiosum TaxID=36176 RepID=UPI001CB7CE62|nr:interleukin-20-like [Chiloscyllium plagiosum]